MTNRPLYVRKYSSSRLKEFNYEINDTFDESKEQKEIIGLSDNQILRTVRNVNERIIDRNKLEILIHTRDMYKRQLTYQQTPKGQKTALLIIKKLENINISTPLVERLKSKYVNITVYSDEVKRIQNKINRTLFNEDYVTVVMNNSNHYRHIYENGFIINGKRYKRLSCSAGQARVSTVVFASTAVLQKVITILNNGRDLTKKFSPSKFNAYFGLSGSATKVVSEPKFIVIRDYQNTTSFDANFVIENGENVDDTIVKKQMKDVPMNRTDGMGLISYRQALVWSKELGLDYIPSQFCIRQNFIKGMLCVFPIHEFCEEVNNGSYIVDTIYKDSNGDYIKADLRDYDVILTESQFKLWDCFDSIETYIDNCHKNKLQWGIALTTPKEAKRMLKLNYQFIQSLSLNKQDVEKLASQFVEWIQGVSYENINYILLFLLGINNDTEKIRNFLNGSENYWLKSLIINHDLKDDKFIRTKIRELIKKKIKNACKGDIYVDGNFQVLVSDPYGFMQHVCGLPVTGLLKEGEFYSNYWNRQNVSQIDGMRSPLTYYSEHVVLNLRNDNLTNKWYRYCDLGVILNYHGHETFNFAGSDFDFDILATTPNKQMIKGVLRDELPVVYDVPIPEKKIFNDEDLYLADTFSFGSIIGSITNKSSNGYALLALIKEQFGLDSQQYKLVKSRLMQCCKAQSAQIDKAKIGKTVKGIPKVWVHRNRVKVKKDGVIVGKHCIRNKLYNDTLLDRYPYFFRYVYKDTDKAYKKYVDEYNVSCQQKFQINFDELIAIEDKSDEQTSFIQNFYKYCPVLHSNSSMNLLCRYIESIDFNISKKTTIKTNSSLYDMYKCQIEYKSWYDKIIKELQKILRKKRTDSIIISSNNNDDNGSKEIEFVLDSDNLCEYLSEVCSNPYIVANCLIDYYYEEKPTSNKDLLWGSYGKYIYKNIKDNAKISKFSFPFPDDAGDISYLGYKYKLQEVSIDKLQIQ